MQTQQFERLPAARSSQCNPGRVDHPWRVNGTGAPDPIGNRCDRESGWSSTDPLSAIWSRSVEAARQTVNLQGREHYSSGPPFGFEDKRAGAVSKTATRGSITHQTRHFAVVARLVRERSVKPFNHQVSSNLTGGTIWKMNWAGPGAVC